MKDQSEAMLETLPEIGADKTFCFDCGPAVPCFNRCCAELALPLTPYDFLRLARNLQLGSDEILQLFTQLRSFPDTGFPLPMLKMIQSPDAPCPFVTPAGCSVYEDRPGACRSYPLGRGTKITNGGISERFFLVNEDHCKGFEQGTCRTASQWFTDQGLAPYNSSNDRYMRLISMVRATGKPLEPRMTNMCLLCLYQLDRFRDLIRKMNIFSRVEVDEAKQQLIMTPGHPGDEACLDFAFDWLELMIFGISPNLRKKGH